MRSFPVLRARHTHLSERSHRPLNSLPPTPPLLPSDCATHARPLLPAALASVSFGFVLVRVRVRVGALSCNPVAHTLAHRPPPLRALLILFWRGCLAAHPSLPFPPIAHRAGDPRRPPARRLVREASLFLLRHMVLHIAAPDHHRLLSR